MPKPLHTPRVNNNDDTVRLAHLFLEPGAHVKAGDMIADIETDKATFTVEAEEEGYLLAFNAKKGDTIAVGSVLAWIGSSVDERVPIEAGNGNSRQAAGPRDSTLKAALLAAQYGVTLEAVPSEAGRISAADVQRYASEQGLFSSARTTKAETVTLPRLPEGTPASLSPQERGMMRTIAWQTREAAPGYVEVAYDGAGWSAYATEFQKQHGLLISPLIPLIAWKLTRIAGERKIVNSTIRASERYQYNQVNLGFTIQVGENLYVVVAEDAGALDASQFVKRLSELQRSAMKNALRPNETEGATIGFSSMSRWNVTRHIPILLPYTALMIAHAADRDGTGTLGATYDHRVLTGATAVQVLLQLARP